MSATPRSTHRLLLASATVLLGAGLLSAAHADQAEGATPPAEVAVAAPASLPVDVSAPPEAAAPASSDVVPVPTPATPAAPPAAAAPAPEAPPAPAPQAPVPAAPAPAPAPSPARTAPAPTPAPAPAPRKEPAPAPAQPAQQTPAAEAQSDEQRIEQAYASSVPAAWRGAITARFEVIDGATSWASSTGMISIGRDHMRTPELLADVIAHEFGHLIAFRYGSQKYAGAPPAGWPAPAERPEEAWADCVQRVFLGRSNPSHGLAPCDGEQLRAAQEWLAPGPGAHKRTG